ncbi:CYFA0S07e03972g1_1 [Cyberlindnera fabianii]|uniref:CYFA0S07e03972g1_1 n=1 Tax=Cyberlindnera fabianii TaxID=36022 RepID=A0A061AVL5_CYBFA|nr:CYFA0S07e03972g1_1 [Cyberlindnera fabianii]
MCSQVCSADKKEVLLTEIPADLFEPEPLAITSAYNQYITSNNDFAKTTILEKHNNSLYTRPYQLYHDLLVATYIQINSLEIGSKDYVEVDRFYKFSTELFLRECYRLHITIDELKASSETQSEKHEASGFEEMLTADFDRISTSYNIGHSEAYVVLTQNNIPVFTSLNERSALDERQVILPDNVQSTKVIPTTTSATSGPLGDLSPHITRLPQANAQSGEILSRFLHPNWYSLPTSKWLETSDLQSFAPLVDEQMFVVSSADKSRLWLETIGHKKLEKWRKEVAPKDDVMTDSVEASASTQDIASEGVNGTDATQMTEDTAIDETYGELSKDDFFNLYEWSPQNDIEEEEIEAFENSTEQDYLNKQLAKLQSLRKERYAKGLRLPSKEEEKVYYTCSRLLKEIIYVQDTVPDVKPSALLPVEQFIYPGTLPVAQQNTQPQKRKYQKRVR